MSIKTPSLSNRALDLPRSSIRRLFNAAKALEAQGHEVYRLDIGDPDFEMPPRIGDAVTQALREGETHYSPTFGIPPLRGAIARHLRRRGLDVDDSRIVCSQGATQALHAAVLSVCDAGRSVLYPQCYFPNYMQQAALTGVRPLFYPLDDEFQPILGRLEDIRDERLQAILINSPSNPTGAVFPADTIRRLYDFARRRGLWIISDEAYVDFVFKGETLSPLQIDLQADPEERRVLAVYSFSKSFAVTGLRMGWTVAPNPEVALSLATVNEPLTGCLTTPLQWGMVAALSQDDSGERRRQLAGRLQLALEILRAEGLRVRAPHGGMFFFMDVSATGMDGDTFADRLLEEERVAVVPGSGFALVPDSDCHGRLTFKPHARASFCIRFCFAVPEERLRGGLRRLASFINRHSETE
ncbi:MAG TPA: pyridoxal phosphate-dependent aminotransferase [Acidobacteriota bacterium]|nr:pyridoxal phosphate-dependent aminotransferase [Acidobacteriota bacterium]